MTERTPEGTSGSGLLRITILEGPGDWIKWARDMEDYLGFSGFGRMLPGAVEETRPLARAGEKAADGVIRLDHWEDKATRGVWAMKSRCGQNARDEIQASATISAAFASLEARFKPTGSAIFQQLNYTYRNLTLDQCKGISDYAERLKSARNDIQALDSSTKISEPHFVDQFLTGLDSEYTTFLSTFHQTHSLLPGKSADGTTDIPAVTFDQAVMATERHEQGLKVAERGGGVALIARMARGGMRGPCAHCSDTRHHESKCFKKHPDLKAAWERTPEGKLYLERKKKRDGKKFSLQQSSRSNTPVAGLAWQQQLPYGFMAINPSGFSATSNSSWLRGVWILDSGCTNHVSSDRNAFIPESLTTYTGPPMAGIGGATQAVTQIGTAVINCCVDGKWVPIKMSNTFYHPDASCNLISISQLKKQGAKFAFTDSGIDVITPQHIILHCDENEGGLYLFRQWKGIPQALAAYSINKD
jgi:hypothetical protein